MHVEIPTFLYLFTGRPNKKYVSQEEKIEQIRIDLAQIKVIIGLQSTAIAILLAKLFGF